MESSFYLPQQPVNQSSGASLGLWIAIISGTILLGVSFFLVQYYLLREKYNPPVPTTSQQTNAAGATPAPTLAPCPAGKTRADKACKMCIHRRYPNCNETYCKCTQSAFLKNKNEKFHLNATKI